MADVKGRRYGFVILTRRCIDCEACQVACRAENQVPLGHSRNWVRSGGVEGAFPDLSLRFEPGNCMHCDHPVCVDVCPTGASHQRADGVVLVDANRCVGCRYCVVSCPYEARFIDEERGLADKCTLCVHRLDRGTPPSCVTTCVGGARWAGDLNDPNSLVSRLLATYPHRQLLTELGTGPAVYYIDAPVPTDDRTGLPSVRGEVRDRLVHAAAKEV
ncbi:4Fe-4S dicluster domain-containing protein [Limnochorda pilosa]|uniref:4Fe-4S ferredoxin n=1 Tax=Limnochorda pilosa TaxID=1555112 RepID=A0A0K2SJL4_LIMPI|nr:4Fe-4S dicluster domain-containing protein [Limnochorda pilosa]BAS27197.1 4Fe-4S ferredoxin [Limnochorda pilosa]